jgi:hypothetical protein
LVLVHPKSHVCLFCLEKKGWSDEFPTQVTYNEHYTQCHSGVIEERAGKRQRARVEQRQKQAERRRQVELQNWARQDMCIVDELFIRIRGEREFPFPTIPGNTSLPFPFPKAGNGFFIPIPVPKSWE